MNVLLVLAHPERRSFNGAMFDAAVEALGAAGHAVITSDLYRMGFDPISSRRNFTTVKDADCLKLQMEELHASEVGGFAAEVESEIAKVEAADLMIWQFPLWWFALPAILKDGSTACLRWVEPTAAATSMRRASSEANEHCCR
jgi:NAD(P)H dehydrogenase (quinone)